MSSLGNLETHGLDDFASLVAKDMSNHSLNEAIRALHKNQAKNNTLRSESGNGVLSKLLELSEINQLAVEAELEKQNTPPPISENFPSEPITWVLISSIIFKLNPIFSVDFPKRVIENCLARPTHLGFALLHSDIIVSLAKNHPATLNPSLVEVIILSTDDSRSIYALKVARWLPEWLDVKSAALTALISGSPPKQTEAMWLVNERGNTVETISFLGEKGIIFSQSLKDFTDIRLLTRKIVESVRDEQAKGIDYAIKMSGTPLSDEELAVLLSRISKTLDVKSGNR